MSFDVLRRWITDVPRKPSAQRSPWENIGTSKASSAAAHLPDPSPHERQGDRASGDADDPLLRAIQVRERYGNASDMWVHRKLKHDPTFPRPIYLGPTRYWRLSDLLAWERAQAERRTPQPRILEHQPAAIEKLKELRAEKKRKKAEQAETAQ